MPHKIGAYVRVSSEEQALVVEGSIQSQQYRLKMHVNHRNETEGTWGRIIEFYIDEGYSAGSTKRPAYQRMMTDLRSNKIDMVLITDLSRLSRDISDFSNFVKETESLGVKFLSIKDQFDSSTPAGEMMLYNIMNLAQFERKQTSERVSINFHARAMRGLFNGGGKTYGFDPDTQNPGRLLLNENEASAIRMVFKAYIDEGNLCRTVDVINQSAFKPKIHAASRERHKQEGRWTYKTISYLLRNPIYTGTREINKKYKDKEQATLKPWRKYLAVENALPAIVSKEEFATVQRLMDEAKEKEKIRFLNAEKRVFILSGVIHCSECGRALIGQSAHGKVRVHRYYGHRVEVGETLKCSFNRLPADELEQVVLVHLDEILETSGYLDNIENNIKKSKNVAQKDSKVLREQSQKELYEVAQKIDSVFKMQLDGERWEGSADLIAEKLSQLNQRKKQLQAIIEQVGAKLEASEVKEDSENYFLDRLGAFKKGWRKANPLAKKRLLQRVIENLIVTQEGLLTYYRFDSEALALRQRLQAKMASGTIPEAIRSLIFGHSVDGLLPLFPLTIECSSSWASGGSGENRTPTSLRTLDFESSAATD